MSHMHLWLAIGIRAQTWFQKGWPVPSPCESSVFIYESKKQFCESSIESCFVLLGWKRRWLSELTRGWLLACTVSLPGVARLQFTGHCNSHNIPQPAALSAESEYCMLLALWRTYCRGWCVDCDVIEPTNQLHDIVLEKLTFPQLVNKFCIFCRTQRFITVSTRTCCLFLSWTRWIQAQLSQPSL